MGCVLVLLAMGSVFVLLAMGGVFFLLLQAMAGVFNTPGEYTHQP